MRAYSEIYRRSDMDTEDLSVYCPHCGQYTSLSPGSTLIKVRDQNVRVKSSWTDDRGREWWIGVCNSCKRPSLVQDQGRFVYPAPLPPPTDERIPEAIRRDLDEAKVCFGAGAPRGCASMARRAIQSACRDKGATRGKLEDEIDDLAGKGIITHDLKDWADNVRWIGNDASHPDSPSVEQDDAEDILKLADQFLQVIYVTPAIAKDLKKKRQAKKAAKGKKKP